MAMGKEQWSAEERSRIEAMLRKVLESRSFSAAARLQDLLRYLVTESLAGRGDRLNQSSIAIDVQGKDANFDPATDSQVRVEAGRLRAKLREYYDEEGGADEIRFELPKGMYEPRIRFGAGRAPAEPAVPLSRPVPTESGTEAETLEGNITFPTVAKDPSSAYPRHAITLGDESIFPTETRTRIFWAAAIAIALIAIIFFVIQRKPAEEGARKSVLEVPTRTAPHIFTGAKSLAVLPFLNSSATAENAGFFADGLHDDLLTQLTKIADLKVISRTSVMGYRDAPKPIPQIAAELGVHAVLEGTVQRVGDRVRVNVQLIDGRTDQHIWAESFDQELNATNIFEIQRRIALEIAAALQAKLSPQEEQRLAVLPTHNFGAYELYLKARQRLSRRTLDDMAAGSELFQQALDQDPEFALAYVGLAESAYLRNVYGGMELSEMFKTARPALARAFEINDQIGEAWTVEGAVRVLEENRAGAEEAFKRAIELNPNYAQAWHWYGSLLEEGPGRKKESLKLAQKARELDPLSPLLRANLAESLESQGRLDDALNELKAALELDPNFEPAINALAFHYLWARGDVPAAMRLLAPHVSAGRNMDAIAGIGMGYQLLGELAASGKWVDRYVERISDPALTNLELTMIEFARDEDELAAKHAGAVLAANSKYLSLFRPFLLSIVCGVDLRAGRVAEAKARYLEYFPELGEAVPRVDNLNLHAAIDLANVLRKLGENDRATALLDGAAAGLKDMPRRGKSGYGLADVEIAALRGDRVAAIAALRRALLDGWIYYWFEFPDKNPNLELLHGDPDYKVLMKTVQDKLAIQSLKVRDLEKSGVVPVL